MANVQHLDVYSGENRTLTLYARSPANVATSLSGKTIAWYVGRRPTEPDVMGAIITKTGTVTVTASGVFTVSVTPDDTEGMEGDYMHMAKTTDGSGNIAVVCTGRFRIRPDVTA